MKRLLILIVAAVFCLTGCQSMNKEIEPKKFAYFIQLLKNQGKASIAKITILSDSILFNEYKGAFQAISFCTLDANEIRELVIEHSYHPSKLARWESYDWSSDVIIEIHSDSENPICIHLDPTGFSFDENQGLTGFSNPELANYLVDMFEKAGLPEISKLFKDNKYLYESYIEMDYRKAGMQDRSAEQLNDK